MLTTCLICLGIYPDCVVLTEEEFVLSSSDRSRFSDDFLMIVVKVLY